MMRPWRILTVAAVPAAVFTVGAALVGLPEVGDVARAGGNVVKDCPPGLAKKNPPCVPPGLARKWRRGDYIPPDVPWRRLDYHDYRLPPPPPGHVYVNVGRDIYLVAEATRRVIEAINLIDAATR